MFDPASVESSSSKSSQLCRRFTFSEIQLATKDLNESLVIGRGGFGKVYKGTITDGPNILIVAIKRLDSTSNQGESEFWAEINMLSDLRHCHLVSLIGYCNDGQEMILVYEYMSHGSLEDHLHKRETPLSWVQRLTICIGAARGLDYLHTGTGIKHGVVHRDVKSSNILLDDSWEAKISDFGLSKICPKNQHTTYINTGFKGTFGYVDPDYFYTGKLTRKSDVYAFGVVLFEVLCGKQAVDSSIVEEHWNLAVWAQEFIKEGRLKQIVDTDIRGAISPKCLKLYAELAKRCLHKNPKKRPLMAEAVVSLETMLALQAKINYTLQPASLMFFARKALKVIVPSNGKNSGEDHVVCFNFDEIKVATDNFSEANRISKHTSNFLYKGKLPNGQGIAVAERPSGDILIEDYLDDASTLVKLQHENVAKFIGSCSEGTRFWHVYDFALHATLDHFLFDPECTLLSWDKRYQIILGVSRALLYLHREAWVLRKHSDISPGDILLDESFNPALPSFYYARCLAIDTTDCYESTTTGIRDYSAPEYELLRVTSTRADVYSLGVLVLKIIIGHRTMTSDISLEYVRRNWFEGTLSDITDPRIDAESTSLARFFEIGLLCVKKDAADRPTMEEVVSMLLDSSSLTLPVEELQEMRARMIASIKPPKLQPMIAEFDTSWIFPNDHDYDTHAVGDFLSELSPR